MLVQTAFFRKSAQVSYFKQTWIPETAPLIVYKILTFPLQLLVRHINVQIKCWNGSWRWYKSAVDTNNLYKQKSTRIDSGQYLSQWVRWLLTNNWLTDSDCNKWYSILACDNLTVESRQVWTKFTQIIGFDVTDFFASRLTCLAWIYQAKLCQHNYFLTLKLRWNIIQNMRVCSFCNSI